MSKHLFVNLTAGNIAVSNPDGIPIPVRPWLQRPRSAHENIETLKSMAYIMEGEHYATMVSKNGPLYPLPEDFLPTQDADVLEVEGDVTSASAGEETVEIDSSVTTENKPSRPVRAKRKAKKKNRDLGLDADAAVDDRSNLIHNLDSDEAGKD